MALICPTTPLPSNAAIAPSIFPISSSFSSTAGSSSKSSFIFTRRPVIRSSLSFVLSLHHHLPATVFFPIRRLPRHIVRMAPEEGEIVYHHPLDIRAVWDWPNPPRRPNIFPTFRPMQTPLPLPTPEDPPIYDEEALEFDEEEEELDEEEDDQGGDWEDDGIEM